jgi:hypothetical protein
VVVTAIWAVKAFCHFNSSLTVSKWAAYPSNASSEVSKALAFCEKIELAAASSACYANILAFSGSHWAAPSLIAALSLSVFCKII